MTLGTFRLNVRPIQFETSEIMIKGNLIDRADIIISALVLFVAVDTVFRPHQSMKMSFGIDILLNVLVTGKTVLIGNAPTRFMALQTILMFEIFVTQGQGTGCEEFIEKSFEFSIFATLGESYRMEACEGEKDREDEKNDEGKYFAHSNLLK